MRFMHCFRGTDDADTSFLATGVAALAGSEHIQSSLDSDSSSVASYSSSRPCIWSCHSVSEHEEALSIDNGDGCRVGFGMDKSPEVWSFSCGGLGDFKGDLSSSPASDFEYCDSLSSTIVFRLVLRACRKDARLAVVMVSLMCILDQPVV